jgi:hypothetical protein
VEQVLPQNFLPNVDMLSSSIPEASHLISSSWMKQTAKDPNKTLSDFIAALSTPKDGTFSRGYMVLRSKNACGTLQVITANSVHPVKICWTVGILPALSSVLKTVETEISKFS